MATSVKVVWVPQRHPLIDQIAATSCSFTSSTARPSITSRRALASESAPM